MAEENRVCDPAINCAGQALKVPAVKRDSLYLFGFKKSIA